MDFEINFKAKILHIVKAASFNLIFLTENLLVCTRGSASSRIFFNNLYCILSILSAQTNLKTTLYI